MRTLIAMTAAAGLLVAGCSSIPSDSTKLTERTAPVEYNTVVFTDYDLSRTWGGGIMGSGKTYRLSVINHGRRRTETGTTEVYAVLRNHTDHDYQIEARTQFFDQDGVPVDARPTWQRSTIPANSVSSYKELSTGTQPLQYRVEVRGLE
ncbi:YcfL family protein [uncultured Marinobacter sp.]|uniref:YcfL family protein n=1 Tax=uncultured Marinobacter sp. TaxID=187379 RepID=UPI002637C310|nr:YcfL family protein [uncultured Marinobacter sp.]